MTETQVNQVRELATTLAAYHPDSLCHGEKSFNFGEYRLYFEQMQRFFQLFGSLRLELIPLYDFSNQSASMRQLKETLDQIVAFDPLGGGDPQRRRQDLFSRAIGSFNAIYSATGSHLTYGLFAEQRVLDFQGKLEKQLAEKIAEVDESKTAMTASANEELAKLRAYVSQVVGEMKSNAEAAASVRTQVEEIAQNARKAAQITGVSAQSKHFEDLATEYAASASDSLLSAIIIGAFVLVFGWLLFGDPAATTSSSQLAQKIMGRLIFISVGFTAFVVCLRNYAAARHNYTVNRHKATTLQTFEVFINGTANNEIKEMILLQAAKTAFEPQSTGFLRSEGDGPQFNQMTEVVRAITPSR